MNSTRGAIASAQLEGGISRAEDGIRTRDPHLGKVYEFVHRVRASSLSWPSVYGMSTESARIQRCCRAVHYEVGPISRVCGIIRESEPPSSKRIGNPLPAARPPWKTGSTRSKRGTMDRFRPYRDQIAFAAALVLPLGVAALLVPFRGDFANTASALILVAVIVAVAALGNRFSGFVATVGATLWFDVFLTEPYERLAITHRPDIETAVCLFVVGIIVTELAARNRHHHASATEEADYVGLIYEVSELVASGAPATDVRERGAQRAGRSAPPASLPLRGGPEHSSHDASRARRACASRWPGLERRANGPPRTRDRALGPEPRRALWAASSSLRHPATRCHSNHEWLLSPLPTKSARRCVPGSAAHRPAMTQDACCWLAPPIRSGRGE